jgi:hypothetical protein
VDAFDDLHNDPDDDERVDSKKSKKKSKRDSKGYDDDARALALELASEFESGSKKSKKDKKKHASPLPGIDTEDNQLPQSEKPLAQKPEVDENEGKETKATTEEFEMEHTRRLEDDLRKSDLSEQQIAPVLKKAKVVDPDRPTYTRTSRKYLSIETLNKYKIDFEWDQSKRKSEPLLHKPSFHPAVHEVSADETSSAESESEEAGHRAAIPPYN